MSVEEWMFRLGRQASSGNESLWPLPDCQRPSHGERRNLRVVEKDSPPLQCLLPSWPLLLPGLSRFLSYYVLCGAPGAAGLGKQNLIAKLM